MSDTVENQIRLGLRLLAEDVQPPVPIRTQRRPSRRGVLLAFASLLLLGAVGLVTLGRSSAPTANPRFIPDAFNYQPPAFTPGFLTGNGGRTHDNFTTAELASVSAAAANDAWIVGTAPCCLVRDTLHTLAWHWDGAAWQSVPTPDVADAGPALAAVVAIDGSDAWAVGNVRASPPSPSGGPYRALIEHWDGTQWAIVPTPQLGAAALDALSATGRDNVWAAGVTFTPERRPLLLHWDGATWRTIRLPWSTPGLIIEHVVATEPSGVWAVGTRYGTNSSGGSTLEYWNGEHWRSVRAPFGPDDPVRGFTATSGSDAWAVGSYAERAGARPSSNALAAHWNGSDWKLAPLPSPAHGSNSYLRSVVAVRPDDVWAFGSSWGRPETAVGLFEHWDGQRWTVMSGVVPKFGSGPLTAASDGTAWAIDPSSCDNVLVRWNGDAWGYSSHPQDRLLNRHDREGLPRCTPSGGFTR